MPVIAGSCRLWGSTPSPLCALSVRLIKVCLPNGKLEILATSLQDTQRYPTQAFGQLYGMRWGVEEAFKTIKQHLDIEGFSGELPHAIEQDIHAKTLIFNIMQALCWEATQQMEPIKREKYAVNSVYALKHASSLVTCWLQGVPGKLDHLIASLVEVFSRTLEMIRPGRSFPRRHAVGGAQRPRKAYR